MSFDPIRLGVAGLGRAFTLMLPTLLGDERVRIAGACDPRETARQQFARDFNAPVYENIEALAAEPDIEAIYIATPHQMHAAHTRAAAERGKHVLVEKPMALTLQECDEMIGACLSGGVHLIVGHCHSFDSPYLLARQIIRSQEVGAVRMIHALNYTDFLYRPRRPEELSTEQGGGVVFSQAAHHVDIVRLLAGTQATKVRAVLGAWDAGRPTEGAYMSMLWFDGGAVASLTYSGYAHFDSDEWCDWIGEMGMPKSPEDYGRARRRLLASRTPAEEAALKASGTYGSTAYRPDVTNASEQASRLHQHFGPIVVSCERADVRPVPNGVWVYGHEHREHRALPSPGVPRFEVIDELYAAVRKHERPLHGGEWGKATLEICLAMLQSSREGRDVALRE